VPMYPPPKNNVSDNPVIIRSLTELYSTKLRYFLAEHKDHSQYSAIITISIHCKICNNYVSRMEIIFLLDWKNPTLYLYLHSENHK
jgi:hypothetical protein